jgi:diketogulonate reductase-like aldo/keto reductase
VGLAWVLRHRDLIAIPRAGNPRHVRENRAALDLRLTAPDLAARSRVPSPTGPQPLATI